MANRTVSVKLRAEIAEYMANMRTAGMATKKLATDVATSQRQIDEAMKRGDRDEADRLRRRKDAYDTVGSGLLAAGTAAVTAAGMAAKAAIDWESAFAGVAKTVDGTAAQMEALEGDLRNLATSMPTSHEEVAAVAESAGQLGVAREDVASFTKVMIDLGETTNLTAEQAATAIAQIANVMGMSHDDVDRFGSALVALGNDGASTESEILQMAQRIAGAGNQIGLAETDVLGMASALASVGINAEAGGSSISTAMIKMSAAVNEGGGALEGFAKVAGMSSEQFASLFQQDSEQAIVAFVEGLGDMQAKGEDVFGVLNDLGLSEIRTRDAMLRLAGAGDLLRDSLELGEKAWKENTALAEEAAKRYATAEAQIQVAWNSIKDAAISAGSAMAPIIGTVADAVGLAADAFNALPGPIQEGLGLMTGLIGVVAVASGGLMLMAPRIHKTKEAIQALGWGFGGAMKKAALFGGALGVVTMAGAALGDVLEDKPADIEAMAVGMERWAKSGVLAGEAARVFGKDAAVLKEALSDAADTGLTRFLAEAIEFIPGLVGIKGPLAESVETMKTYDDTLAHMARSGDFQGAAQGFDIIARMAKEQGISFERLKELLPGYAAELEKSGRKFPKVGKSAAQMEKEYSTHLEKMGKKSDEVAVKAGNAADLIAIAFNITGADAEETAKNVQKMFDQWSEAYAKFVPLVDAYTQALDRKKEKERESAEATAESTDDSSDSWEDYLGDVSLTVEEYLDQLERMVKAQEEWADNMINLAGRVPNELLDYLARLGPEGADLVALLNDMTDAELKRFVKLWESSGADAGQKFAQRIIEAAPILERIANDLGEKTANKIRDGMKKRGTTVYEEAKRHGVLIDRGVDIGRRRIVKIDADPRKALEKAGYTKKEIDKLLGQIEDEDVNVKLGTKAESAKKLYNMLINPGKYASSGQIGPIPLVPNAGGNVWAPQGENHTAQIAPAGAWRVWAEDETGGEAYIPLSPGKRTRSLQILQEVARRFDRALIPMADGGVTINKTGELTGLKEAGKLIRDARNAYAAQIMTMVVAAAAASGYHPGLDGALKFVKSQVGKPYSWGGVGPGGYDCSGLISAAINVALGRKPHQRLGSTASMPWSMFAPGRGAFMVGWFKGSPGHTAGTINGVNIESRGGQGVVVGASARGADDPMFTSRAHVKGFADGGIEGPFNRGFRYGTDYVPWDGLYKLHRGEQVVPPQQSSGGQVTRMHPEDLRAITKALQVSVNLDGKEIARSTAKHNGVRADLISRGG